MPGKTPDVKRIPALCDIGNTSELLLHAIPLIEVEPEKIMFVDKEYNPVEYKTMSDILLPGNNYNKIRIGVYGKIRGTFKDIKHKEKDGKQLSFNAVWKVMTKKPDSKEPRQVNTNVIKMHYETDAEFVSFDFYYDVHCLFAGLYGEIVTIRLEYLVSNTLDNIDFDMLKIEKKELTFSNPLPFSFYSPKSIVTTKIGEKVRFTVQDLKKDERDKDEDRYNRYKHFEKYNFYLSIMEMDDKKSGERKDPAQHSHSFLRLNPGEPLDWLVGCGLNKNDFTLHYPDRYEKGDYEYCYELYLRYRSSDNNRKYLVLTDPFIQKAEKPTLIGFNLMKTNTDSHYIRYYIRIHLSNFSDNVKENTLNVLFTLYQYVSPGNYKIIGKPFDADIPVNQKASVTVPHYVPEGNNFATMKITGKSLYLKRVSIPIMKIFYFDLEAYWPCDVTGSQQLYFTLNGSCVASSGFKNQISTVNGINVDFLHHPAMIQIFGWNGYYGTIRPRLEKILTKDYVPKIDKWDYHTQDIQKMLKALGYFGGSLNGRWGIYINAAFARFSRHNGILLYDINSDGVIKTPEILKKIDTFTEKKSGERDAYLEDVPKFRCKPEAVRAMIRRIISMYQG